MVESEQMASQSGSRLGTAVKLTLTAGLMGGALWLLAREIGRHDWQKIQQAFGELRPLQVISALAIMVGSYVILVAYDWLALKAIGRRLPWYHVALASFVGHATSYNFGALLGGTTVRFRFYNSWGLSGIEIVRLVSMLAVTFWFGVFALAGILFVLDPLPIPPDLKAKLHLPDASVGTLGWFLLAITAVYLIVVFAWQKPIRWRHHELRLPGPPIAIAQLVVAAIDLTSAAACAYALMPADFPLSPPVFLSIYLLAVVTVVFTHVPGGVGIFELTVLTFVGASEENHEPVLAGLLAFRVVYYLVPLFSAALTWGIYELARLVRRNHPAATDSTLAPSHSTTSTASAGSERST